MATRKPQNNNQGGEQLDPAIGAAHGITRPPRRKGTRRVGGDVLGILSLKLAAEAHGRSAGDMRAMLEGGQDFASAAQALARKPSAGVPASLADLGRIGDLSPTREPEAT